MKSENVSVGALISIQVQVSCKGCNGIHEAEAIKEADSEYLVNNDKCQKCDHKNRLVAKQGKEMRCVILNGNYRTIT